MNYEMGTEVVVIYSGKCLGGNMFVYVQRLGKSFMLPIATLPICGILLGLGYLLAPSSFGAAEETAGLAFTIGTFLTTAGSALINNIGILFAIGVGIGMAKKQDGAAAIASLAAWLVFITILDPLNVEKVFPLNDVDATAFKSIANPFIGIISGLIGATCFNKFSNVNLPEFLAFFSGKRFVAIMAVLITSVIALILMFVWPLIFAGLTSFTMFLTELKAVGVGIYTTANRLLIPVGLHHALNSVVWFDTIGIGDLTNFWAGKTSADVGYELGSYMSGFFPAMMFGIPGACTAMILLSKNKKATFGILLSLGLCAFLCGITEPFEFLFMFVAFPLYVIYAFLFGIVSVVAYLVQFKAGFSFSAGLLDLIFSSTLPAAQNTWMIIPLGLGSFVLFFAVFYLYIKKFDVPIPGSGELTEAVKNIAGTAKNMMSGKKEFADMAEKILEGVGGIENIKQVDHCVTRLRLTLNDNNKVDEEKVMAAGASGVMKPGKQSCQVVIGTKVQFVYDEFVKLTEK